MGSHSKKKPAPAPVPVKKPAPKPVKKPAPAPAPKPVPAVIPASPFTPDGVPLAPLIPIDASKPVTAVAELSKDAGGVASDLNIAQAVESNNTTSAVVDPEVTLNSEADLTARKAAAEFAPPPTLAAAEQAANTTAAAVQATPADQAASPIGETQAQMEVRKKRRGRSALSIPLAGNTAGFLSGGVFIP